MMKNGMTKKELASLAGYTYRRLYDIDRELPQGKKLFVPNESGKYDTAQFVQNWVRYNVDNNNGDDLTLDDAKTIHEKVKTRKTELEVAKMEGNLVDVIDIKRLWGNIANTVMQNMTRLPSKIAPMVVSMQNIEVVTSIIDDEIRKVLTQISETPLPSYTKDEESENDNEEV